jgi:hypothetical protein
VEILSHSLILLGFSGQAYRSRLRRLQGEEVVKILRM